MLNSLIIILREVLEAAIIISVLLASLQATRLKDRWLLWGFLAGVIGSVLMANQFRSISDAFDGVGQEILNAGMLFSVAILISIYLYLLIRYSHTRSNHDVLIKLILFVIILLAVIREGMEIIIYITGYIGHLENKLPLLIGGSIGGWIGFSIGIIIYYSLLHCALHLRLKIIIIVTAIISAGMVSEGMLYLIQADWIEGGTAIWDSSSIVAEPSILGQLLYATFSYEATPSGVQVAVYALTLIFISLLVVYARILNARSVDLSKKEISEQ